MGRAVFAELLYGRACVGNHAMLPQGLLRFLVRLLRGRFVLPAEAPFEETDEETEESNTAKAR